MTTGIDKLADTLAKNKRVEEENTRQFGDLGDVIPKSKTLFDKITLKNADMRITQKSIGSSFVLGHSTNGKLNSVPFGDHRISSLTTWRREKWDTNVEFQAGSYTSREITVSGNQIQPSGTNGAWMTQKMTYSQDTVPAGWKSTWGKLFFSGAPLGSITAQLYAVTGSTYPEDFSSFTDGQWLNDSNPSTNGSWSFYGYQASGTDLYFKAEQLGSDMTGHFKDADVTDSFFLIYQANETPVDGAMNPFMTADLKIITPPTIGAGIFAAVTAGGAIPAIMTIINGSYTVYDNVTPTPIAPYTSGGWDEIIIMRVGSTQSPSWKAGINGVMYGPFSVYGGVDWPQEMRSLALGTIPSEVVAGGDTEVMECYIKNIKTSWNETFTHIGSVWKNCEIGSVYTAIGSSCKIAFALSGNGTYLKDVSLKYNGGNW